MIQNYSVILLPENNEVAQNIVALQHSLSEVFGGDSAIQLPLHITLLKWKSDQVISQACLDLLHNQKAQLSVLLESIELSGNNKALWYKIKVSGELLSIVNRCYHLLLENGIRKSEIKTYGSFHLTLAYKDYEQKELIEMLTMLNTLDIPHQISLMTAKTMVCAISPQGKWELMP